MHRVIEVVPGSIADEGGVVPGDMLVSINGERISDIFDYRLLSADTVLELLFKGSDGEDWILEIERDEQEDDDLGLVFEDGLMDKPRSCRNNCVFCFIDQLPRGMRDTLYFKDDDLRLSLINGNYVTLTNTTQAEIERVIRYRLSPVCVSVHTTDPALRARMLRVSHSRANVLPILRSLSDAGIIIHAQIVLCLGYNDGAALDSTLGNLGALKNVMSVSVVPSGLTGFREGLTNLKTFGRDDAARVLSQLSSWQKKFLVQRKSRFVYPADELFLLAGKVPPSHSYYEGYPQLENGVGMVAKFRREFLAGLDAIVRKAGFDAGFRAKCNQLLLSVNDFIFTGKGSAVILNMCARELSRALSVALGSQYPPPRVVAVPNKFFGGAINVTGLLTGSDILEAAKGIRFPPNSRIFLSKTMFRHDSEVFLDDFTLDMLRNEIKVGIIAVENNGRALIRAILAEN